MSLVTRLYCEEEGQGLTEYALIITGISIALIATLGLFKNKLIAAFEGMNF